MELVGRIESIKRETESDYYTVRERNVNSIKDPFLRFHFSAPQGTFGLGDDVVIRVLKNAPEQP